MHAQQKPLTSDQQKVVDTVTAMFTAAQTDDLAKFDSVVAPSFYMFDSGSRYNGDSIMSLIKRAHAAGIKLEWEVIDPDVHITGNSAWIAYVNRGSVTDPKGTVTNKTWLESAFLKKQHGAWKLVFFQSTPVAAPQSERHGQ